MIYLALEFLRRNLDQHLVREAPSLLGEGRTGVVVLGEPGLIEDTGRVGELNNKIILSLLYAEEETTLKNASPYRERNGQLTIENPPLYLNLTMICCAFFPGDYAMALQGLSAAARYFQSNRIFSFSTHPVRETEPFVLTTQEQGKLELTVEMVTLSIEQYSDVWGSMKTRSLPSLVYRVRLVELEALNRSGQGNPITEFRIQIP